MKFKELYEKVRRGEATEEEKKYVEEELEKAKEINDLLYSNNNNEDVIREADVEEVKKVKKSFRKKTLIATIIIGSILITLATLAGMGTFIGIGLSNANKNITYTMDQAKDIAIDYIQDRFNPEQTPFTNKTERELDLRIRVTDSRYIYEIEVIADSKSYDLEVDAKNGNVILEEIDIHLFFGFDD